MPNPNIRFPILRRLVVKEYSLFPGKDGDGIDHTFEPGVTVIPGINGIGKTTLLNIIYRLLVGPFDPFKDEEGIQLTQTHLKKLDYFDYFSKRDRGASTRASALGEFEFREHKLVVTRRLNDLSIVAIAIDGIDISSNASHDFEAEIWRLSGCGTQYDFHLLVRSLLFFMEQKTSVVWDPIAQAEIFRILFLHAPDAMEFAKLAHEIQRFDSRRRNMLAELNRYKKQLTKMQAQASVAIEIAKRAEEIETQSETIDSQLRQFNEAAAGLEKARDNGRQRLDALKLDLEEATRSLEYLHHLYFASLFPNISETAKNTLINLVSDNGCLVCGSRLPGLSQQFQRLAEEGACPVCRSPKEQHEQTIAVAQFGSENIQQQIAHIAALKNDISELEHDVLTKGEQYKSTLRKRLELQSEQEKLNAETQHLRGLLPASAEAVSETEHYLKVTETEIAKLENEIEMRMDQYRTRLALFRDEIEQLREKLTSFFAEYAGSFLAEKCELTFAPQKLQLGQAVERVEFPSFAVQMTSAVSPSVGTTRTELDDVSESQKEFIDLAFRMAVLRTYAVATGSARCAMIVIETPEASLDSVFIGNAGQMLRKWCGSSTNGTNSVIATSNLNRENMILSLLGLRLENRPYPSADEVKRRILNLMEIAAPNAALKQYREHYEAEFRNSTTPEIANG